jgi:hypothetical protein
MNNSSNSNSENRQSGRFDWIFSETTISVVLLVTVLPAILHGLSSLQSLPTVI